MSASLCSPFVAFVVFVAVGLVTRAALLRVSRLMEQADDRCYLCRQHTVSWRTRWRSWWTGAPLLIPVGSRARYQPTLPICESCDRGTRL